ncbi:MAG: AAA family ATPase [Bacteroidales bacterium]|jgi:exodeoxyribonuclease-5|nr:AAA family ATPase [Bacteroidales bacterium]
MKKLSQQDVFDIIMAQFPFEPTGDQTLMTERLSEFLIRFREPSFFVMKGYAGTGKTTMVGAFVRALPNFNLKAILLAPTGRAAKVLAGYSGQQALTIHKKIYKTTSDEFGGYKTVLQKNPHRNTIFIVDEASMIPDINLSPETSIFAIRSLLEDLVSYANSGVNCKLVLVGDTAQLPPVGLDMSPALDLEFLQATFDCDVFSEEMREVVRQSQDSGVLYNAASLRVKLATDDCSLPLFDVNGYTDIQKIGGAELEDALNSAYSKYSPEEVVIITRSNKRANIFNHETRNRILFREESLTGGDLMMVLKNNYFWLPKTSDIGFIANGDMLEIQRIRGFEDMYGFEFANVSLRLTDYPDEPNLDVKLLLNTINSESPALSYQDSMRLWNEVSKDYQHIPNKRKRVAEIKQNPYLNALQVKFAYALTAHKTQGGQWKAVFIDQGYFTEDMLNAEFLRWLYTTITRATETVYLVNFADGFFGE